MFFRDFMVLMDERIKSFLSLINVIFSQIEPDKIKNHSTWSCLLPPLVPDTGLRRRYACANFVIILESYK